MTVLSRERAKVHNFISLQCNKMYQASDGQEILPFRHVFGAEKGFCTICMRTPTRCGGTS